MLSASRLKHHQISILHFSKKGVRSAARIHHKTNIPIKTIYYNIEKLKLTGSLKHRGGNSQPHVFDKKQKKAIGKYVRRNNEITLIEVTRKISKMYQKLVSTSTISHHFLEYDYIGLMQKYPPIF